MAQFLLLINNHEFVQQGVPGVRYNADINHGNGGIQIALGHVAGCVRWLELAPADAMELIELLAAAIGDAHGIEQPFIDRTGEPCTWACCSSKAVR
ncbi:hypothetical protein ACFVAV_27415 [Nocardia sp. NPDC057663]|uniref:hypothetical protein n=1 Tax=Nocardia sp. NPDC057663 TaxID=3346201 RepID=UPI0036700632